MKYLFLTGMVLLSTIPTLLNAQDSLYYNLVWPFGYSGGAEGFGISKLDFRSNQIITEITHELSGIRLGMDAGSFFSDKNGYIALLSDGCRIYNGSLEVISGEEYLHPGRISNDYCPLGTSYPVSTGSIMLPSEESDSIVYFVSGNSTIIESPPYLVSDTLGVWKLSLRPSGNYEVTNVVKINIDERRPGKLTAFYSHSESVWWLASIGSVNQDIKIYRVGGEEILSEHSLLPTNEPRPRNVAFQAAFSPNGLYYSLTTDAIDTWLFDFDPVAGELSNLRRIDLPPGSYSKGICFSPNSELIYVTADTFLYQIEIATETVRQIGSHFSYDETGWPVNIGEMHLGPDCRIYVGPSSTTWYLHVIHDPNQIGVGCDFQPRAIRTPTRLHFSLPNMPLYPSATECLDIPWPFEPPTSTVSPVVAEKKYVTLSPNPARGDVQVKWLLDLAPARDVTLGLYDATGRPVHETQLMPGEANVLARRGLAAGVYHWALRVDGRWVQSGRLLWME